MPERRMAEIVRQRERLGEILVETERPRERARDLLHFQGVRQPRPVMIALVEDEDLGLVFEPAEGGGMDDAVAVAPEIVAASGSRGSGTSRPRLIGRDRGIGRAWSGFDGHFTGESAQLTDRTGALNYRT